MATIKDIARQLDVSASTVARALNDHPHISQAVKDRVRASARELSYVVHEGARTMRGRSSRLIGFVVPKVSLFDMSALALAVADICNDAGYQLVLCVTGDDAGREHAQVLALIGARTAGIMIMPTDSPKPDTLQLMTRVPSVFVIRQLPASLQSSVVYDDVSGAYDATRHLTSLGHQRIAYLGISDSLSTGASRFAGYRRALTEAGIGLKDDLVAMVRLREGDASQAFRTMLDRSAPTAIVLANPFITGEVLETVHELGLVAPRDLSIVGFGNEPWMKWWGGVGLTTVGFPVSEVAAEAARLLLSKLQGTTKVEGGIDQAMYAPFLIHRGSTGRATIA